MKSKSIPYRQETHGDFDAEWAIHRNVSGWWYLTGYFNGEGDAENLYSYQFTVIKPWVYGLSPYALQLAITDFQTGKHDFLQRFSFFGKDVYVNQNTVNYKTLARLENHPDRMFLSTRTDLFECDFKLEKGKGAIWHGDDGVLIMGNPVDKSERTVYYSYTNMPTTGEVRFHNPGGDDRSFLIH